MIDRRTDRLRSARRLLPRIVAILLVAAVPLVVEAEQAEAAVTGNLMVQHGSVPDRYGQCLDSRNGAVYTNGCAGLPGEYWTFTVVTYVGTSPRYSVRNAHTNQCLVAFASSGNVGTYTCNTNWADQIWSFEYVRDDPGGNPLFWLRNKHSGRCLVANYQRATTVFMHACANYNDQLFFHFS
jgi:hypothetical protein